jgi:hypothetical protein
LTDEWIKKMPHTQNMRAEYGLEKKEINMDKPGVQYVK